MYIMSYDTLQIGPFLPCINFRGKHMVEGIVFYKHNF